MPTVPGLRCVTGHKTHSAVPAIPASPWAAIGGVRGRHPTRTAGEPETDDPDPGACRRPWPGQDARAVPYFGVHRGGPRPAADPGFVVAIAAVQGGRRPDRPALRRRPGPGHTADPGRGSRAGPARRPTGRPADQPDPDRPDRCRAVTAHR